MKKQTSLFLLYLVLGIMAICWGVWRGFLENEKPVALSKVRHYSIGLNPKTKHLVVAIPGQGSDALAYDFVDSLQKYVPKDPKLWQKQWRRANGALLADSSYENLDSFFDLRLLQALGKGSDTSSVFHALIQVLEADTSQVVRMTNTPQLVQKEVRVKQPLLPDHWLLLGLGSLLCVLSMIGLFALKKPDRDFSEKMTEEMPDPPATVLPSMKDLSLAEDLKVKAESKEEQLLKALLAYSDAFMERYGDFYEQVEKLPYDYSPEQEAILLKQLIEMGVLSHSYHRQGKQSSWKYLASSPNAQLVLGKEVDTSQIKSIINDPTKTDRKFRFLAKILEEHGVNELKAFLRDEVKFSGNTKLGL